MYKLIDHLAAEDSISTFVIMSLVLKLGTKIIILNWNCQHRRAKSALIHLGLMAYITIQSFRKVIFEILLFVIFFKSTWKYCNCIIK